MPIRKPDLDNRGMEVNTSAQVDIMVTGQGTDMSSISLSVPKKMHTDLFLAAKERGTTVNKVLNTLILSLCDELDVDTSAYAELAGTAGNSVLKRGAYYEMPFDTVMLDECDFPTVAPETEVELLDPYYSTSVVNDEVNVTPSKQMRELRSEINKAAEAVAKLTRLKAWTSVYASKRITKAQAVESLEEILSHFPAELGDALWGWCSLNDALWLIDKWRRSVMRQIEYHSYLDRARLMIADRKRFNAMVQAEADAQRDRMLGTMARQKARRPVHEEGEWPTWAGEMESYADVASNEHNQIQTINRKHTDALIRRAAELQEEVEREAIDQQVQLDDDGNVVHAEYTYPFNVNIIGGLP